MAETPTPTNPPQPPGRRPDDATPAALDPANKSLMDALRLSFRILQVVMVLLILVYLKSGYNIVPEQSKGIRLTFGQMSSETLEPGGHFSWPAPIGDFVTVRTASREVELLNEFWIQLRENERNRSFSEISRMANEGLRPGTDGSIITADHNLAHTKWKITYRVRDPRSFVEYVHADADEVVLAAAERGVVHAAAVIELDTIISTPDAMTPQVKSYAQNVLDEMGAGIEVESVSLVEARPPRQVLEAYESVTRANADAKRAEAEARRERARILNDVAGGAFNELVELIREYESLTELAADDESQAAADEVLAQIDELIQSGQVAGQVAELVGEAQQDRIALLTELRNEYQIFSALYEQYRANPELTVTELWSRSMEDVAARDFVRFWLSEDTTEIVELKINTPADIIRQRQREVYEADGQGGG
ncbi:MAG: SPFH domain-containing protein [Phycisphaerales bacterium]